MSQDQIHITPTYKSTAFTCPHCGVTAAQEWGKACFTDAAGEKHTPIEGAEVTKCANCQGFTVWREGNLVMPPPIIGPPPCLDLAEGCREWYEQARAVASVSPRGACGLLRGVIYALVFGNHRPKYSSLTRSVGGLAKQGIIPRSLQEELRRMNVIGSRSSGTCEVKNTDDLPLAEAMLSATAKLADHVLAHKKRLGAEATAAPPEASPTTSTGAAG